MKILDSSNETQLFKDVPIGMIFRGNYTYIKISDDVVYNAVRLDNGKIVKHDLGAKVEIFPNATLILQGV